MNILTAVDDVYLSGQHKIVGRSSPHQVDLDDYGGCYEEGVVRRKKDFFIFTTL